MRCLRVVPCVVLAALLVACGNEPLTPTEDVHNALFRVGGTDRPFYAETQGLATFAPDMTGRCPVPSFGIITTGSGTGEGTHLGRFLDVASHCPGPAEGEPPPYAVVKGGEWRFVAANGDELYATYEGEQLTPLFENPTLTTSEVVFVGGTGRFSGASGWAHVEGRITVPDDPNDPWPFEQRVEGRISY